MKQDHLQSLTHQGKNSLSARVELTDSDVLTVNPDSPVSPLYPLSPLRPVKTNIYETEGYISNLKYFLCDRRSVTTYQDGQADQQGRLDLMRLINKSDTRRNTSS